jgi:hypothetical protein
MPSDRSPKAIEDGLINGHNIATRARQPSLQRLAVGGHDRFADEGFDEFDASVERSPNLANAVDDDALLLIAPAPVAQLGGQFDARIVAAGDCSGHGEFS